jgi:hypothetical protein
MNRPRWLSIVAIGAAALASVATSAPSCPIATEPEPQPLGCATVAAEIAWKSRGGAVTLRFSATEACRLALRKVWIAYPEEGAQLTPEAIAIEPGQTVERVVEVPTSAVKDGRGRKRVTLVVETDQGTAELLLRRKNCSGCCGG